jgi:hypothetical protein
MERAVAKLIQILLVATATVSAGAHAHYVEVWNPPEARAGAITAKPKTVKRKKVDAARLPAGHPPLKSLVSPGVRRAPNPGATYDDIPRKLTPEGNVLRVGLARTRPYVER